MNVHTFTFNAFQENTYVLEDEAKNCVVIDPGCYERHEQDELFSFIENNKLKPIALLSTHAHIDHVLGNAAFLSRFPVDYYLHPEDIDTLRHVAGYAHLYGFEGYQVSPDPTCLLDDKQQLVFGGMELQVIFGPGHCPGHVAFYAANEKVVVNGDILFKGSFGRTDLPGGSMEILKKTIHERMFTLPDETVVYCGHGPATTIGEEKKSNMIWNF